MRRPDCEPFCSVILLAGRCRHCDVQRREAAATTTDIERVSLVRALDLAPEPDGDYDLMDQLAGAEPPEIHWP